MKNCTITFKLGDTSYNLSVSEEQFYGKEGERSLPTEEFQSRLARVLKANPERWNEIKQAIIQHLKNNSALSYSVSYSTIASNQGLVPNVNFKYIQDTYPDVNFPSIDVPILLLDNLDMNSKFPVSGRVLNKEGREIFVVKGDQKSITQLSDYLKIREKVKDKKHPFMEGLDEELLKDLQTVFEELKDDTIKSIEDLMLQFLNNKSEVRKKADIMVNGRSAYTILNLVGNAIKKAPGKTQYKNPILNEFNQRIKSRADGTLTVDISEISKVFIKLYPHIISTQKGFKELFTKRTDEIIEILNKIKNPNNDEAAFIEAFIKQSNDYIAKHPNVEVSRYGMSTFFDTINSFLTEDENPMSLKVLTVSKDRIILDDIYPTFKFAYGFNYDTVASFTEEEDRKGWHIYSQTKEVGNTTKTYYYATPYHINENLQAQRFSSIEQAQEYIDNKVLGERLKKDGLSDLKFTRTGGVINPKTGRTFESRKYIPKGTVITSINLPVDFRSMYDQEYLLLDGTLQEFYDYINSLSISSSTKSKIQAEIDTAEKAMLFLSEINRIMNTTNELGQKIYPRNNDTQFIQVVEQIKAAPIDYVYINNIYKTADNTYRVHYIPTTDTVVTTHRKQPRTPVIQLLNSIAKVMEEKFGVKVHVVNTEELIKMGIEDLNLTKAFIRNGEIYINSSIADGKDAFHEYGHLFLGVLKSNPQYRDNYIAFIQKVVSTSRGATLLQRKKTLYPNVSAYDLAEEVVADLYGEFMENYLPYELSSLFATNKDLEKAQETIFNKDKSKKIADFDGSLETIWKRFNADVAWMLKDNMGFIKDGSLQVQRQKATWINKLIELNKQDKEKGIKENC